MTRYLCSAVSAVLLAFACNADNVLATSTDVTFKLDTTGPAYSVASQEAIASMLPTTWRKGETVTVTAPNGTTTTLVADAGSAGAQSFTPNAGGIWHFFNSASGAATLGVPWSVFGDGGELATGTGASAIIDTKQEGPDRRVRAWNVFPIAYSGNSWLRGGSSQSTLTLVSPSGTVVEEVLSGTGCYSYTPTENGKWHIELNDGTSTLQSDVLLMPLAFFIFFR